MKTKFILESFDQYVESFYGSLNEASSGDLGFAAILGSTDKQNLGDASSKIGIGKNTTYTVKIKNIQDLVDLGTKKTFEGFTGLAKGDAVGDKIDFITITSKGETKKIAQKVSAAGNIILDFDNSGMEIKAANNGMLALMRACVAASQVFGQGGVDPQKTKGKFLISMGNAVSGDTSRNAAFLAVSNNILGDQDSRYGRQDILDKYIPIIDANEARIANEILSESEYSLTNDILLEQESILDGSSLVKLVGDCLADSIRAAIVQYSNERGVAWRNNSFVYGAFKEMYRKISGMEKIKGQANSKKITPVVLSMIMEYCIKDLAEGYPIKKANINAIPVAKEILKKIGNKKSTKLDISDLENYISKFRPEKYDKIPQFNPILGDFWQSITSAVVLRAESAFAKNANDHMEEQKEGERKEVRGGKKSGEKKNTSGEV